MFNVQNLCFNVRKAEKQHNVKTLLQFTGARSMRDLFTMILVTVSMSVLDARVFCDKKFFA